MGRSKPSATQLFKRGDIPGLIEALDVQSVTDGRANDARVALSLIGEPAIPLLMREIGRSAGRAGCHTPTSFKCHRARIAMASIGEPAVPHLMDAIRYGDARLAEGAAECLEEIEEGGVVLLDADAPTRPIPIAYPADVRAAFEYKLGRPLAVRSLWRARPNLHRNAH
ncbi:MAG: hypothetical protein ACXVP1_02120 [Thermoleophilia bacterium]